jgi:hypothetical protein
MRNGLSEVNVRYVIYGPIIILANVNIEANKICTIQTQLLAYFDSLVIHTNLKQIKKVIGLNYSPIILMSSIFSGFSPIAKQIIFYHLTIIFSIFHITIY